MSSLKYKTFTGVAWSFVDTILGSGITFIVGLIMARLLSPEDFGLIGVISVFIAFANTFIDSGFSTGLIRKSKCENIEFDTVFWFNILISLILFIILFFLAPLIESFFKDENITVILRILGIVVIVDSLSLVQKTILIRRIDFKSQTLISMISSVISGSIGILLAFKGFGVWSLVVQILTRQTMYSLQLWLFSSWRPEFRFSIKSFTELFEFGSKMLGTQLIQTTQNNLYYFVIGKFFSSSALGYYTRAEQFNSIVTNSITNTVERVFFPVLASLQDESERLKETLRKTLKTSFFVTFIALLGMSVMAKPMIYILIGSKWDQSVLYLQMLCIGSVFFPFNVANLNILKIKGRSDLILKLQLVKTFLVAVNILFGIFYGIIVMLISRIITTLFATVLNSYYSGHLINYRLVDQIKDIIPYFISESMILIAMFGISLFPVNNYLLLLFEILTGSMLFFLIFENRKYSEYLEVKSMISGLISSSFGK